MPGKKRKADNEGAKGHKKASKASADLRCDEIFPHRDVCSVYVSPDDGVAFRCVLNQTNIGQNNNKFFIIQVCKERDAEQFYAWIRWGRVGYTGQTSVTDCGRNPEKAVGIFTKKFLDKTKNKWEEKDNFVKHHGKYDLVKTGGGDAVEDEVDAVVVPEKEPEPESKLDVGLQNLIRLICDVKAMESAAESLDFDAQRNPLGKISEDQIKAGYESLNRISEIIKISGGVAAPRSQRIVQLSNEFYTRIPHCFGMRTPPAILTMDMVKVKITLLEVLGDIKDGLELIKLAKEKINVNKVDSLYSGLNCDLKALSKASETFELLEQYIMSTHGHTHDLYVMNVEEIFECSKSCLPFKDHGNRMLLFHGSRMANWAGILSNGLKIAPKEAPVTGYMFGKGIYFADVSSKSANYCHATRSCPHGLLLLCEVSLGNVNELKDADYKANKLPKGKKSVKGLGKITSDPVNHEKLEDGTLVPLGPVEEKEGIESSLLYNEYIVYNTDQVRLRYIAKIKFDFA